MLIRSHVHYFQDEAHTICQVLRFDPPAVIDHPMGRHSAIYGDEILKPIPKGCHTLERVTGIINKAGVVHIQEEVQAGHVISLQVQRGKMLADICMREEDHLDLLVSKEGLLYWFITGKGGLCVIQGRLAEDVDGIYQKVMTNIGDLSLRDYFRKRSMAQQKLPAVVTQQWPEVMNHKQAAAFLGMSPSTLYKKVDVRGGVPRRRDKKYLREELIGYLKTRPRARNR